jgi:hypothetical protein
MDPVILLLLGSITTDWVWLLIFTRFLDHTQRRTTVGRTPLDEWSVRRRDLYLTTHNNHNRQTSMPPPPTYRGFLFTHKNPTASAGFEASNLGTKGQHATSRPPKPLSMMLTELKINNGITLQRDLCSFFHSRTVHLDIISVFIYQLTHKRVALKIMLRFTLKQLRHVSV